MHEISNDRIMIEIFYQHRRITKYYINNILNTANILIYTDLRALLFFLTE